MAKDNKHFSKLIYLVSSAPYTIQEKKKQDGKQLIGDEMKLMKITT